MPSVQGNLGLGNRGQTPVVSCIWGESASFANPDRPNGNFSPQILTFNPNRSCANFLPVASNPATGLENPRNNRLTILGA